MLNHKKVIPFPRLSPSAKWRFFDYVEGLNDVIEEWYQPLSDEARGAFDALLKNTSKIELPMNWTGFKHLKGAPKEERIWQLDFIADKRQYRVLGVFGDARRQAILLLGCYHKGDVYTPHKAIETACRRARALREGLANEPRERKIKIDL